MNTSIDESKINEIRKFNRFFTRKLGVLREGLLHSPFSLTEARVLFEVANNHDQIASELTKILGLDAGYLSRILTRLEQQGLLERVRAEHDGRQQLLRLTPEGQGAFKVLDQRSREEVAEMLKALSEEDQKSLIMSMTSIQSILDNESLKYAESFYLRRHQPGDMGWITHRHGVLYAQEYGWDESFEALVAQIVSDFINNYKPEVEHCWVAEMKGEIVGSVFLVQVSESVGKLRLLLVEPSARGLGLGTKLVEECVRFAKRAGYKKLVLWTNSILKEARHIYKKQGFILVSEEEHHSFGHDLIGEMWELEL